MPTPKKNTAAMKNQKPTDGRKNNKRQQSKQETREIVQKAKSMTPAQLNKAKKDRVSTYALKAMKKVFGSEAEAWETLAEKAKEGSFAHLNLLWQYKYGKPIDKEVNNNVAKSNAPVINFFNNAPQQEQIDNTIDVDYTEDKDE
jgi:hypothetical protein